MDFCSFTCFGFFGGDFFSDCFPGRFDTSGSMILRLGHLFGMDLGFFSFLFVFVCDFFRFFVGFLSSEFFSSRFDSSGSMILPLLILTGFCDEQQEWGILGVG